MAGDATLLGSDVWRSVISVESKLSRLWLGQSVPVLQPVLQPVGNVISGAAIPTPRPNISRLDVQGFSQQDLTSCILTSSSLAQVTPILINFLRPTNVRLDQATSISKACARSQPRPQPCRHQQKRFVPTGPRLPRLIVHFPWYVANKHGLHQNKTTTETGAESPTTARPLEMDDDDVQDTSVIADDAVGAGAKPTTPPNTTASATPVTTAPGGETPAQDSSTEAAPPKPPRPVTEAQKNEMILKEAFPTVEDSVIKAVLRASGGKVEPAFNALLGELIPLNEPTVG